MAFPGLQSLVGGGVGDVKAVVSLLAGEQFLALPMQRDINLVLGHQALIEGRRV